MRNVRVWFEKDKECRFISHLDLNRVMLRAVQKSRIPVWHTEGFNPHPFITFALPLSLGFRGKRESMDFRLLDEDYPLDSIPEKLNACLPEGIRVYSAADPLMKPGSIAFAEFDILLSHEDNAALNEAVHALFAQTEIITQKKGKAGIKDVDLKPKLGNYEIKSDETGVNISIILPAGSGENINPSLLIKALEKYYELKPFTDMTRVTLYNAQMQEFA